jgi:HD-GYP domain-containing protein (c-di-GMP phosphodiesterase class II)
MLRVPLEQAKTNMVLARSVSNPEKPEHVLLKAGYSLEEETISRLRSLKIKNIWVKYPNLDFLDEILDPEIVHKQQNLYSTLKNQFSETQDLCLAKVDYSTYIEKVSELFSRLLTRENSPTLFISELQGGAEDILAHCTTVSYLSLLMGLRLESYLIHERPKVPTHIATDLTPLGVGCLLHDIGKLTLPEDLRGFHLTAQDLGSPQWRVHTEAGYEMIQGGLEPSAAQVVLNHHQHYDGSGFPARKRDMGFIQSFNSLKGKEIHVFCRIITIADRFDGLRHMPDGEISPVIIALKRMKNPGYMKWFDPVIYPFFMQTVPPFAPGDQVTLNNRQPVVVTEFNEKEPCRPVVRPIDLSLAEKPDVTNTVKEPDINLALRTDLYIKNIGDLDVTKYLF